MGVAINHRTIRQLMRKHLRLIDDALMPDENHCQWEGRKYTPVAGENWLRETYMPVTDRKVATGLIGTETTVQYDVYGPQGEGTERIEDIAKAIAAQFESGTSLTDGAGLNIAIDRAERGALRDGGSLNEEQGAWVFVPVQVRIRSYVSTTL